MTGTPPPSAEREKAYKQLQEKAKKIHEVIVKNLGNELTPFDVLAYSCNTFAQSAALFPDLIPFIKELMRRLITMSLEIERSNLPTEENGLLPK